MDNQLKQDFTRRISQCNRGGMIIIIYDIFFAYVEDIRLAKADDNRKAFKESIRNASDTLDELMNSLDFKYDLSKTLYSLYMYCKNNLAKAMYEYRLDKIDEAEKIMRCLYDSFEKVAAQDTSEPVMKNAQQVYAGMTYGRYELNENCSDDIHRGFFV